MSNRMWSGHLITMSPEHFSSKVYFSNHLGGEHGKEPQGAGGPTVNIHFSLGNPQESPEKVEMVVEEREDPMWDRQSGLRIMLFRKCDQTFYIFKKASKLFIIHLLNSQQTKLILNNSRFFSSGPDLFLLPGQRH
ncbi:hypothetical protein ILYODFUR_008799 [Ilyodon furcidens]|uniref:Uncharacterized protein n=1 Tax=Ilyodon furcidens TaxID=33524 RepID=A0ABV0UGB0_9TELE